MKALKTWIILIALPLFIAACSAIRQVEKPSPFKFTGATLSKDINTSAP